MAKLAARKIPDVAFYAVFLLVQFAAAVKDFYDDGVHFVDLIAGPVAWVVPGVFFAALLCTKWAKARPAQLLGLIALFLVTVFYVVYALNGSTDFAQQMGWHAWLAPVEVSVFLGFCAALILVPAIFAMMFRRARREGLGNQPGFPPSRE